jgi:hypothetical protein
VRLPRLTLVRQPQCATTYAVINRDLQNWKPGFDFKCHDLRSFVASARFGIYAVVTKCPAGVNARTTAPVAG